MDYHRFRFVKDYFMRILIYLALISALIPLFSILYEVFVRGASTINMDFFIKPTPTVGEVGGGVANAIQGTLITIGLASLMGVPIGLMSGIFLSEYSESKLSMIIRFLHDVLNGIPSIVIGVFAYTLITRSIGFSVTAAAFALAVIMIPIVTRTTEEALKLVPMSIREAAIALGIPRWKVTMTIVLSSAKKTIVTGILLSIARIAGESAPVLVTMGFWRWWFSGLNRPVANLALNVFIFAMSPFKNWVTLAWGSALILILMILIISVAARTLLMKGWYYGG
ncbi:MAG: phosphate ABC transporter permease PstA [archaeon YNP-LCB-003-016]|uniref:phosphate ABC transporter permease PstA n=1 Tax=Candidatus Culexarchaeum yellowstonense TaxID=2928963 RepID=UPI0026EABA38|nr:phosphate ABC transporter permease PstA [Candidatus Culexarchaeum yellowstonense]MCR6691924.1 phosphate ABC transporter permease PstA [Candidatus Culexarchaeum yellowstonense]